MRTGRSAWRTEGSPGSGACGAGISTGSYVPYDVHVLSLDGGSAEVAARADELVTTLAEAGVAVLLDDRDERPGEKFADADLIGCPVRVIVGKKTLDDESVDVRRRDRSSEERVAIADVLKWVLHDQELPSG